VRCLAGEEPWRYRSSRVLKRRARAWAACLSANCLEDDEEDDEEEEVVGNAG